MWACHTLLGALSTAAIPYLPYLTSASLGFPRSYNLILHSVAGLYVYKSLPMQYSNSSSATILTRPPLHFALLS